MGDLRAAVGTDKIAETAGTVSVCYHEICSGRAGFILDETARTFGCLDSEADAVALFERDETIYLVSVCPAAFALSRAHITNAVKRSWNPLDSVGGYCMVIGEITTLRAYLHTAWVQISSGVSGRRGVCGRTAEPRHDEDWTQRRQVERAAVQSENTATKRGIGLYEDLGERNRSMRSDQLDDREQSVEYIKVDLGQRRVKKAARLTPLAQNSREWMYAVKYYVIRSLRPVDSHVEGMHLWDMCLVDTNVDNDASDIHCTSTHDHCVPG
ncbi:hypothetical protein Tco_0278648 [Tanacetum coccineum]